MLVVEAQMRYQDILELTPRQIMAICTEKSQRPGLLGIDDRERGIRSILSRYNIE